MNWTNEWPTIPGYYWFYGWKFENQKDKNEFHFVKMREIQNGVCYVTDGHFLYKAEGADGIWMPVIFPDLPEGV